MGTSNYYPRTPRLTRGEVAACHVDRSDFVVGEPQTYVLIGAMVIAVSALSIDVLVQNAIPETILLPANRLLRLAKHGLKLGKDVMDKLSAEPKGAVARAWYNLALKEQGRPFDSYVPTDDEASGYMAWKFGLDASPVAGEWADVL